MKLRKTYAAKIKDGKIVTPQRDIDMHALEENEVRAKWALNEATDKIPKAPSQAEEHEWLLDHGAIYVKQKRAEWQKAHNEAQPAINHLESVWRGHEKAWNDHATLCHANGLDHDTFVGDARQSLKMPKGK